MLKLNEKLTPDFQLKEFFTSPGSLEYLQNSDILKRKSILDNVLQIANRLQVIRDILNCPLIITSGVRSEKQNAVVGGADRSAHLTGGAVDFKVPQDRVEACKNLLQNWSGGFKYYEDGHFHVDIREGKFRW